MKIILLVLLEQYADWEAAYVSTAVHMLGQGAFEVKTVSLSPQAVGSIGGIQTVPDYTVDTVPEDYAALLLIGGMRWREERARGLLPLVSHCLQNGRLLGGICEAASFLGAAGALDAVKHTGNSRSDMEQWKDSKYQGADNYRARQAVCDNNIVTANGYGTLEFAREVLLALDAADRTLIEDWYNLHKLGYYNASRHNHFVRDDSE